MRVLTLTQPWAQLVALGRKRVETRSWTTGYRGPVAIHAGKGLDKHVMGTSRGGLRGLEELCLREPFHSALHCRAHGEHGFTGTWTVGGEPDPVFFPLQVPLGRIVAVAVLVDVCPVDEARATLPAHVHPCRTWSEVEHEPEFGDYSPGRYLLCLDNVRRLERPVPYRNGQGLRKLDREQLEGVRGLSLALLDSVSL